MSRRSVVIVFLALVIGAFTSSTRTHARVIHCGSISLEIPDTWRALDVSGGGGDPISSAPNQTAIVGGWEAFERGEPSGYLTYGVLESSSLVSPLAAHPSRRELELRLRDLPKVDDVRITEFDLVEIDGVPAFRARYTLRVMGHVEVDQCLYIVGGNETCFLAFTRDAARSAGEDPCSFDEVMRGARVHDHPRLLGISRERSLWLLAALAGTSLLYHLARDVRARARVPEKVPVESREE